MLTPFPDIRLATQNFIIDCVTALPEFRYFCTSEKIDVKDHVQDVVELFLKKNLQFDYRITLLDGELGDKTDRLVEFGRLHSNNHFEPLSGIVFTYKIMED